MSSNPFVSDVQVNPASLCFAPANNTYFRKTGRLRRDGDYFRRTARAFMRRWGVPKENLILIDNPSKHSRPSQRKRMREQVIYAIMDKAKVYGVTARRDPSQYTAVQFFCHGYKAGIQFGFDVKHLDGLAGNVADYGGHDIVSTLYACDAARDLDRRKKDDLKEFGGDGGFADEYRDALCRAGAICCTVDAHTSAGDASKNPNVRRFYGLGSPVGGVGGFYIVPKPTRKKPGTRALWRAWRKALKAKRGVFRFEFPFMPVGDIHEYLLLKKKKKK